MSTYTPIASQTLASASASVTFNNIPQGYTDLVLNLWAKAPSANLGVAMQFNSDTSASYSYTQFGGNGSVAFSNRESNITYARFGNNTQTDGTPTQANIQNYSNSTTYKSILSRSGSPVGGGTVGFINLWRNTSPITSLTIFPEGGGNWGAGSTFNLYGIAAGSAKAQGGEVTTDGTYFYHTFKSTGIFTPSQALTADVLVIAGGGGGAGDVGGGGGAGGILYKANSSLIAQNYAITIGAGGFGGNQSGTDPGTSGTDSFFDVLKGFGGGAGGVYDAGGTTGGSGGGGGGGGPESGGASNQTSNNGGTGYGNAGGACVGAPATAVAGGGGGGAGSAGTNGDANGGNGGAGLNTWSSWATATNTGVSGFYAGGGGAGGWNGSTGSGGSGGGGNGGARGDGQPASSGVVNTGGGGGGDGGGGGRGGAGGSGLVIVRYAI